MEGTRNERVTVLVASYLIGFVTAYIAFGLTQLEEKIVQVHIPSQAASVITAVETNDEALIAMTKEGLAVIRNNVPRIISVTVDNPEYLVEDGYHTVIADYELSPDGRYLYFCEVPGVDIDVCRPFIYDMKGDVVYPVQQAGERIALKAQKGEARWDKGSTLIFD